MAVYLGSNQIDMFGGNGIVQPTLQTKTINPSESIQNIIADSGYDGLDEVIIQSIPLDYVGSGIDQRDSTDLTISGPTIIVPKGYYENEVTKTIANGSAGTPIATKGTVSNHIISVTPSVTNTTGYITGGTKTGTAVNVSASELVSGNLAITSNGTNINVTNYATASVSVSADMKTVVGTVSNNGGYAAYPNRVDFTVDREPTNFVIVRTSTSGEVRGDSGSPLITLIAENLCLCETADNQNAIKRLNAASNLTIGKSNTNLYAKITYGTNVYYCFRGTYTLYYV